MKVVILAGGFGTRISEESHLKPKPMIEIGGKPILWHIMKMYSNYGYNDFVVCLGYKGYVIKEYFTHYFLHESDVTFDFTNNKQIIHHAHAEPWKVTLVNTGLETMTGGRLKRIKEYIGNDDFMFTYGDGVSDVNIEKLVEFHKTSNRLVTVTSVQPSGRFGVLELDKNGTVKGFQEKPKGDGGWINAGFFVMNSSVLDKYVDGDDTVFEQEPLINLASDGELQAFKHEGFWQPMDTMRDNKLLQDLWASGKAPWKTWE